MLAIPIIALLLAAPPELHTLSGKVIKVQDGDSITVVDSVDKEIVVELNGIDAPELNQAYGTNSKQALSDKVFGKKVDVHWAEQDHHGRTVGIVKIGKQDLNSEMVEEGYAWMHQEYASSPALEKQEAAARAAKIGLWADENPIAPWDFRTEKEAERKAKAADKKASVAAAEEARRAIYLQKREERRIAEAAAAQELAWRRQLARERDAERDARRDRRDAEDDRRRDRDRNRPQGGGGGAIPYQPSMRIKGS